MGGRLNKRDVKLLRKFCQWCGVQMPAGSGYCSQCQVHRTPVAPFKKDTQS